MIPIFLLVLIPLVGIPFVLLFGRRSEKLAEITTSLFMGLTIILFLLSLFFGASSTSYDLIGKVGLVFSLSFGGVSLPFVLIAVILPLFVLIPAHEEIKKGKATFYSMFLLIYSSLIGLFVSSNLLLLFIFLEVSLVSAFFMLYLFSDRKHGVRASVFFLLFSQLGSLLVLSAFALVFASSGSLSVSAMGNISGTASLIVFSLLVLSAMLESPIFPFHVWLPDAYDAAQTPVVMLFSGLISRTGIYVLLLFVLLNHSVAIPSLAWIGVFSMLYLSLSALGQKRFKRMVSYSSAFYMSMAFAAVVSGNPVAIIGGILLMVSYSFITAGVFSLSGIMKRSGSDDMSSLHGLLNTSPWLSMFFIAFILASMGIPGFSNFIGEVLSLTGLYISNGWFLLAIIPLLIATAYYVNAIKHVVFGKASEKVTKGMTRAEFVNLLFLLLLVILLGVLPSLVTNMINLKAI